MLSIRTLCAALTVLLAMSGCGQPDRYPEPKDPGAAPVAVVDRFGDHGTLFNRQDPLFHPEVTASLLPGPNEPIDFDALFLVNALGPGGEAITYYGLDIASELPSRGFVVVDEAGAPIADQLPIVERRPGDDGYSDFVRIHEVHVGDDYPANAFASAAEVLAAVDQGIAALVPTDLIANWALVPDGSSANRRFDGERVDGFTAWLDGEVVPFLQFDRALPISSGEATPLSTVIVIFADGMSPAEGFANDMGQTHNVVETLPGDPDYSSLWQHRMGDLAGFDSVVDFASAEANVVSQLNVRVNCPVVAP